MLSPFFKNDQPIHLERFPVAQVNRSLQAWDSADEYIIDYLEENNFLNETTNIVIFNDSFGALTVNLYHHNLQLIHDSYISQQGVKYNLDTNYIDMDNINFLDSLSAITTPVDIVILKLPKGKAYLEYQLQQIQQCANTDTLIIAAARAKDIHTSTLNLFEKHIGETKTSLAVKKSRLIFSKLDTNKKTELPKAKIWPLEKTDFTISNLANVFSRDNLDIGGRNLLENLPSINGNIDVADLGCGNGVIGLAMLAKNPDINMHFYDESYMAIQSTKDNIINNLPDKEAQCYFYVNDCLTDVESSSLDLVLCNPPFHQQAAVTDHIAWQMFKQSYNALKKGGELRIIGNRQLAYHIKLQRLFGNCETIASNSKFVILSAKK
ncbi:methyltransferase [Thalassotalea psychrophila]|uniref:Ribosomal RNA large subunit methyltransferase G n=1 Tax=Thalassotalea psychrophila TaxID=3065647 RepID=A0ABY9U1F4_9GAMM|nr:methyltransferase [Colwelliaceae bacterium SQ149]